MLWDKTIRMWDAHTGVMKACLEGHTHGVTSVSYCPDGNYIISGAGDGSVRIWNAHTRAIITCSEGQPYWVSSVVCKSVEHQYLLSIL